MGATAPALEDEAAGGKASQRQELYRGFSPFAAFAFCFTSVSVVPSISTGLITSVGVGGPAEMIWAWMVGSLFSIISGLAMAEMASAYPRNGSVYLWASELAPPHLGPGCSYLAGWCNVFGNMAGVAAFAAGFAVCVDYCIQISYPGTLMSNGALVGVSIAVHFLWTMLNHLRADRMGALNQVGTFIQLTGTCAVIVVLLAMSTEKASGEFVFTKGLDCTNFTQVVPGSSADSGDGCTTEVSGYAVVLGITSVIFAFVGYEAGAQIAEETQNAADAAPWGIIGTVLCCFVFGTIYLLGFLFATPDITALADPFVDTFTTAAGTAGGLALMIIVVLMFFFAGIASAGATSRIVFTLARDGALPMHGSLQRLWGASAVPRNALLLLFFLESLLLLLPLVSDVALASVTGTCSFGYSVSYAIPFFLRLTVGRKLFKPGKFSLGWLSMPMHALALMFQLLAASVLLWPTVYPVTTLNMNWTCVVMGAVLCVAGIYWAAVARKTYTGPKDENAVLGSGETKPDADRGPEASAER